MGGKWTASLDRWQSNMPHVYAKYKKRNHLGQINIYISVYYKLQTIDQSSQIIQG